MSYAGNHGNGVALEDWPTRCAERDLCMITFAGDPPVLLGAISADLVFNGFPRYATVYPQLTH